MIRSSANNVISDVKRNRMSNEQEYILFIGKFRNNEIDAIFYMDTFVNVISDYNVVTLPVRSRLFEIFGNDAGKECIRVLNNSVACKIELKRYTVTIVYCIDDNDKLFDYIYKFRSGHSDPVLIPVRRLIGSKSDNKDQYYTISSSVNRLLSDFKVKLYLQNIVQNF
jgi:hypothetical protein